MNCGRSPIFPCSLWLGLCLAGLGQAAWAEPSGCSALTPLPASIELVQGQVMDLSAAAPVTRVAVGDPKVADAQPSGSKSAVLIGNGVGTTSLMVWTDCDRKPRQSMVFVTGQSTAQMTAPAHPSDPDPLMPVQVQADIRFVEVSRSKLKQAGTSLWFRGSNSSFFGSPGFSGSTSVTPGSGTSTGSVSLDNGYFNIALGGGNGNILGVISALESSGYAYTLARPTLTVLNGMSASFLAGGEIPIPVPSSGSDNYSIEYKEYGIRLVLSPTVVGRNRIAMKVAPEVSELDYNAGLTIGGVTVPALTVRRTDTSVSLADGESFVISGLIQNSAISNVDKLPGLGSLPIIGAFFRNSNITRDERELLMIVTPHLVQPLAADAKLPKLPGEDLRTYDPNWFKLYFLDDGSKAHSAGLSR